MENLGLLYALGAALAWGSYYVPFKKSKSGNINQFQLLVGVGIFLSSIIFSIALSYPLQLNWYGVFSGVLWAIANVIALSAVVNLGMSKAIPILSSLVILSNFLWGVVFFGELPAGMGMGFAGIGFIISGVILVSSSGNTQTQNFKKGLTAAVLGGLIFGSQLTPLKFGNVETKDFFFSLSLGIFVTALIIAAVNRVKFTKIALKESILSGIIWNVGNLLSLISISLIGLSKGIPISQSSILVAVFWGLFYFKEISLTRAKIQVLIGAVILVLGIVVLGLA